MAAEETGDSHALIYLELSYCTDRNGLYLRRVAMPHLTIRSGLYLCGSEGAEPAALTRRQPTYLERLEVYNTLEVVLACFVAWQPTK